MTQTLTFTRLFFAIISIAFLTGYIANTEVGGLSFTNVIIGLTAGLTLSLGLIGLDLLLTKQCNLRVFNTTLIGLFFGYLMGETILLVFNGLMNIGSATIAPESLTMVKIAVFLTCIYLAMAITARSADEFQLSLPFIQFKSGSRHKRDILLDSSVLTDARIIDIASSGLLDDHLIAPGFMLNELYMMLENPDECIKNKARRSIDVLKKLETIPTLNLRNSDVDFPELKDCASKLIQLARQLEANIITSDVARLQNYAIEGIRIINIHMLSNVLKPMVTGEYINIKIQRYGKEPRQGVGYLDDGTMVVVNGGAEFLGESIKAQVLSVKHTSSGRMIFCNAADELLFMEQLAASAEAVDTSQKNCLTI
ncbi:MAG: TRAM domain-containing protein [Parachlamydiaceae bacterium]|nr:TRAM domain-containing protein [Parachlamydiaceae bacterium]